MPDVTIVRSVRCRTEQLKGDYCDPAGLLIRACTDAIPNCQYRYVATAPRTGLLVAVGAAVTTYLPGCDPEVSGGFLHYSVVANGPVFPVRDPQDCSDGSVVAAVKRQFCCLAALIRHDRFGFEIMEMEEQADRFIRKARSNGWATYDFETTGLDLFDDRILGFSVWTPGMDPLYCVVRKNLAVDSAWPDILAAPNNTQQADLWVEQADELIEVDRSIIDIMGHYFFDDPDIRKGAHNAYFDSLRAWRLYGRHPRNATSCSMMAMQCLDNTEPYRPLDTLVQYCPEAAEFYYDVHRIRTLTRRYDRIPTVVNAQYCCGDAVVTARGFEILMPHVRTRKVTHLFELQCGLVDIYGRATARGIKIDLQYLAELKQRFGDEVQRLELKYRGDYGINPGSPKQVADVLFEGLPVLDEQEKGSGDEVLKALLDRFNEQDSLSDAEYKKRQMILDTREFRAVSKLKSTYIDGLEPCIRNGRVYPTANIGRARSGRMSYENPNLQNQPVRSDVGRLIRRLFMSDNGVLTENDAAKAEMVVAAWLSGDEKFIQYLADYDIYSKVGSEVKRCREADITKKQRNLIWKPTVLANLYLASAKRLQQSINGEVEDKADRVTLRDASYLQEQLIRLFPTFYDWKMKKVKEIERTGVIDNCFGRRRRGEARYLFNTLIQGTCSDFIQFCIYHFDRNFLSRIPIDEVAFWLNLHDAVYTDNRPERNEDVYVELKNAFSIEAVPRGLTFFKLEQKVYEGRWGEKL